MDLLELTAYFTDRLGASRDLAQWNLIISWVGSWSTLILMVLMRADCSFKSFGGLLRWVQRFSLGLLALGLAFHGTYPLWRGAQPWLPSVMLASTLALLLLVSVLLRAVDEHVNGHHKQNK